MPEIQQSITSINLEFMIGSLVSGRLLRLRMKNKQLMRNVYLIAEAITEPGSPKMKNTTKLQIF